MGRAACAFAQGSLEAACPDLRTALLPLPLPHPSVLLRFSSRGPRAVARLVRYLDALKQAENILTLASNFVNGGKGALMSLRPLGRHGTPPQRLAAARIKMFLRSWARDGGGEVPSLG